MQRGTDWDVVFRQAPDSRVRIMYVQALTKHLALIEFMKKKNDPSIEIIEIRQHIFEGEML